MWSGPVAVSGVGHFTHENSAGEWSGPGPRPPRLPRMDRYTRWAVRAADAAVRDAGLDPARWDGDGVAVALSSALGCYETNAEFRVGLAAGEPSPRLFAATLPSTPVGEVAIHLGARGAQVALAQGADAPLLALAQARWLLASGRAQVVIAIACEALTPGLRALYPDAPPDGAHAFVVGREPTRGALLGAGAAFGAEARSRAIQSACQEAGLLRPPAEASLEAGLGSGQPTLVTAVDPLGGATALVVR